MTTHTLNTDAPNTDAPLVATDSPTDSPVGPIRFQRLLRVEWRKSIDTRAARWLLAAIALLTAGAAMVPLFLPQELQQGWPSYLGMTGVVLALLLPLVSIMTLTSEWGQRSVLVTFTQEPRRGRVVAAKVLSGLALALLGAAFAFGVSAAAMASLGPARSLGDLVDGLEVRHRVHAVRDRQQPDGDGLRRVAVEHPRSHRVVPGPTHDSGPCCRSVGSRTSAAGWTPRRPTATSWSPTGTDTPARSWCHSRCGSRCRCRSAPCAPSAVRCPDPARPRGPARTDRVGNPWSPAGTMNSEGRGSILPRDRPRAPPRRAPRIRAARVLGSCWPHVSEEG